MAARGADTASAAHHRHRAWLGAVPGHRPAAARALGAWPPCWPCPARTGNSSGACLQGGTK